MDDAVEDGRGLSSTYRSPSPVERVSWPVTPTTSFAAVTSAHVASLSVVVCLMGAKIQGTRLRLAMRFRHIRICSEAVRPPVMAGSFMIVTVAKAWSHSSMWSDWQACTILSRFGRPLPPVQGTD